MVNYISETDLILNSNGSIYHLGVKPNDLAQEIILVGDPNRVSKISKYFDTIDFEHQNREIFCTTGCIGNKNISVVSTGMGTDNIDIVINEIDALFNVDFEKRQVKDQLTSLNFYRLGTSGSMQKDIAVDSVLISAQAVGFDALGLYYSQPATETDERFQTFKKDFKNSFDHDLCYIQSGSRKLIENFSQDYICGITATCPGFYSPQSRNIRAMRSKLGESLLDFLHEYQGLTFTNFEMETSGIYLMSNVLGHQAISFNAIMANRIKKVFSKNPEMVIDKMIQDILLKIAENK